MRTRRIQMEICAYADNQCWVSLGLNGLLRACSMWEAVF
jgi:hypothetical protein